MFGNRTISSGLCEARSQAEPGVRLGGRHALVSPRPAGLLTLKIPKQIHPPTRQICTLLLLSVESNYKSAAAAGGSDVFLWLFCQLEKTLVCLVTYDR